MDIHHISSKTISIADIKDILIKNKKLQLSAESKKAIEKCRSYLDLKIKNETSAMYGINTGFGSLCDIRISLEDLEKLQSNLIRSHACGMGDEVPKEIVKIMLLLKIQSLSYGHSGVSVATVERLIDFFNLNILPVVFQKGSLGASGDLAPLAHLSLPIFGEGKVWYKDTIRESAEVLKEHHLAPHYLQAKEGLALINGTQFMSAYGVWCLINAEKLSNFADLCAALSADAFDCKTEPYLPFIHHIRPHDGQVKTAARMLELLSGSEIAQGIKTQTQDPYSFRCVPQVHGASKDAIAHVHQIFETEINSVTDNPNIFPEEDLILSGGNFHGQTLALGFDYLAIALAELGNISERRTYNLISGKRGLPEFLVANPGLNSGFMIPQYTAASIVSENKQLCTPSSVDSIPSSNGQEDHVSMGANGAVKTYKVVHNLQNILAIEWFNAAQAMEFRRPLKSSPIIENKLADYRKQVNFIQEDKIMHNELMKTVDWLNN